MHTEKKLDETGTGLEHIMLKYIKCLAQESEVLKSSAQTATKFLTMKPFKTVVHKLQSYDPANKVNFCNWILQYIHGGETDPQHKAKNLQIKPSHN